MSERIKRHSASVQFDMLVNGVLVCIVAGPVTEDALQFFKRQSIALHGHESRALVVDYTQAIIAFDGGALDGLAKVAVDLTQPIAFVVAPAYVDLFIEHAARMALRRTPRRVFTERASALLWAASKIPPTAQAAGG